MYTVVHNFIYSKFSYVPVFMISSWRGRLIKQDHISIYYIQDNFFLTFSFFLSLFLLVHTSSVARTNYPCMPFYLFF